jgi:hypothetical protein
MGITELNKEEIAVVAGANDFVALIAASVALGVIYSPQPTITSKIKTSIVAIGCTSVAPWLGSFLGGFVGSIVGATTVNEEVRKDIISGIVKKIFSFVVTYVL